MPWRQQGIWLLWRRLSHNFSLHIFKMRRVLDSLNMEQNTEYVQDHGFLTLTNRLQRYPRGKFWMITCVNCFCFLRWKKVPMSPIRMALNICITYYSKFFDGVIFFHNHSKSRLKRFCVTLGKGCFSIRETIHSTLTSIRCI